MGFGVTVGSGSDDARVCDVRDLALDFVKKRTRPLTPLVGMSKSLRVPEGGGPAVAAAARAGGGFQG